MSGVEAQQALLPDLSEVSRTLEPGQGSVRPGDLFEVLNRSPSPCPSRSRSRSRSPSPSPNPNPSPKLRRVQALQELQPRLTETLVRPLEEAQRHLAAKGGEAST